MAHKSEYNAFAKGFSDSRNHAWPEFDQVSNLIHEKTTWLDVGCGNGRLFSSINKGNYTGMDVSEGLLAQARAKNEEAHFVLADFNEDWGFSDSQFDVVVAIASFHHATLPKAQHHWLKEAKRVLKKDGKMLITTWKLPKKHLKYNLTQKIWWKTLGKVWNVPFGKEKHPRMYRKVYEKDLRRLMKAHDLKILDLHLSRGRNWVCIVQKEN